MYGGLARFVVKAGKREEFLELLRWEAQVARDGEPGTMRLDVWEVEGEPGAVYLYEVYEDVEAFEIHVRNAPAEKFRKIISNVIESGTMVIPFGECLISNLPE